MFISWHIVLDIFFKPTTYKGDQFIFKVFYIGLFKGVCAHNQQWDF